jgi:succinate-semialdehyde dehydrogenase/glutarate-semialdehyde dehydrogenase
MSLFKVQGCIIKIEVGDPMDPATQLGPLSSEEAAEHLADQVNRSVKGGAKVLLGGSAQTVKVHLWNLPYLLI